MDFSKCFKTMSLPVLLFKLNFCKNDKRFCLHFLYKTSFFSTTFPKFSMKVKILCPSTILHCCSLGNYILIKLQKCCCEGEFFWHITSLRCSWQTLKSVLKNLWISLRNTMESKVDSDTRRFLGILWIFLLMQFLDLPVMIIFTHFSSMLHFYTPWKNQKTFSFPTFSGGIRNETLG